MKKLYALLMAGVMTIALAMPALAAPSPAAASIASGSTVKTTVSNVGVAAPSQELAQEVVNVTSNAQVLKDLSVPATAHLAAVLEVSYSGEIPAGAKKGDVVYVLHRQAYAPYTWEVVGQAVMGDNLTVTGTFTSFSPVAFMVVNASEVTAAGAKAPKTGE